MAPNLESLNYGKNFCNITTRDLPVMRPVTKYVFNEQGLKHMQFYEFSLLIFHITQSGFIRSTQYYLIHKNTAEDLQIFFVQAHGSRIYICLFGAILF